MNSDHLIDNQEGEIGKVNARIMTDAAKDQVSFDFGNGVLETAKLSSWNKLTRTLKSDFILRRANRKP